MIDDGVVVVVVVVVAAVAAVAVAVAAAAATAAAAGVGVVGKAAVAAVQQPKPGHHLTNYKTNTQRSIHRSRPSLLTFRDKKPFPRCM